jgi:hypothetical protein
MSQTLFECPSLLLQGPSPGSVKGGFSLKDDSRQFANADCPADEKATANSLGDCILLSEFTCVHEVDELQRRIAKATGMST